MNNRIASVLCIMLSVILTLFLIIGVKNYTEDMNVKKNNFAAFEEQIKEYEAIIRKAERKILSLNDTLNDTERRATLGIVFCEMKEEIYTTVFPILESKGIKGILVISGNTLPGTAGRLNDAQILEMYESGWRIIPGWTEDDGETGIASSSKWISDYGYSFEEAVFIRKDDLTEELTERLKAEGYNTFISDVGNGSLSDVTADKIGNVWHTVGMGYRSDNAKSILKESIKIFGNLFFTVGFEDEYQVFDQSVLSSMCDYLKTEESYGTLFVGTVKDIREYRTNMDTKYEEVKNSISAELEENEKIIYDAELAIKHLYDDYNH